MTESEAIEKLKNMRLYMQIEDKNNDCKFTEDDYKANEMAINALGKQIARKPNKAIDRTWGIENEVNVCPVCDCYLTSVHFISIDENDVNGTDKVSYCETCGQKIDYNE